MKKRRPELNYLRVMLCVLIVTTHIFTQYANNTEPDEAQIQTLYWIRMIFLIGTPGFIILSQALTTLNYKGTLPGNYITSRLKYILLPYLIMGCFYSYSESVLRNISFSSQFYVNVIVGDWYGYFILIILQFFLLNWLIYKINPNILNSKVLLVLSVIVNMTYLYFYQTSESVQQFMDQHYFFGFNTFILGWIGYYFAGSCIGTNYDRITKFLDDYFSVVILFTILSYVFFIFSMKHDYWNVTSYNFGVLPYNILAFLILIKVSRLFGSFMIGTVTLISAYSFFIYLLHPIILASIYDYSNRFQDKTLIFIPITLLIVIGTCIGVGTLLKEFKIFRFLIGKQPYRL